MEVVRHQHIVMQDIFLFLPVVEENFEEKPLDSVRLQQLSLLKCASRDEVTSVPSTPARRSGHHAPQRIKPPTTPNLIAALKAVRHLATKYPPAFPIRH